MAKQPYGVLIVHGFTSSLDCVSGIEPPLKALGLPTRMPVLRGHSAESPEALRGGGGGLVVEGERVNRPAHPDSDVGALVFLSGFRWDGVVGTGVEGGRECRCRGGGDQLEHTAARDSVGHRFSLRQGL